MHDLLTAFPVRLETLNNQIIGVSSQQFFQLFVSFFLSYSAYDIDAVE